MNNLVNYFFTISVMDTDSIPFVGPVLINSNDSKIYTISKGKIMPTKQVLDIFKKSLNRKDLGDVYGEIIHKPKMGEFLNSEIE